MVVSLKLQLSRKNTRNFDQNNYMLCTSLSTPSDNFSYLLQNQMLKCHHFLPPTDSYLMMSERSSR